MSTLKTVGYTAGTYLGAAAGIGLALAGVMTVADRQAAAWTASLGGPVVAGYGLWRTVNAGSGPGTGVGIGLTLSGVETLVTGVHLPEQVTAATVGGIPGGVGLGAGVRQGELPQ